ncbi:SH3 domain-containing protein [Cytobacillus sp. FJAT-54145]|uniref:SH3 domain-containing protein n=1 Tax=Cytobacillus spartinae TaxID=3299023 RepID=A0ABW6KH57_9BACI
MHRKRWLSFFICLTLLIGIVPIPNVVNAEGDTVTISSTVLNVREGPGLSYKVLKQVNKGDTFALVKEDGDWLQIDLGSNQYGWVANWLVKRNSVQTLSSQVTITTDGLRVRSGPGTTFQVIGTVNSGEKVKVLESSGTWLKINTSFGDGWISKEFTKTQNNQEPVNQKEVEKKTTYGIVTVASLNVRNSPSLQGSIIGKLKKGEKVQILAEDKEWVKIQFTNQEAWISSEFLTGEESTETPQKETEKKPSTPQGIIGKVTATSLNVRDSGSLSGKVIGTVKLGETYQIIEEVNNWAKIEFKTGTSGWIAGWFLDKQPPQKVPSKEQTVKDSSISIIHNGTNIRKGPSLNTAVILRANSGKTFPIISLNNDWYEIKLDNGTSGFVAGWIVTVSGSAPQVEKPGAEIHLKNKTVIIDPGHGGRDRGATGARGTLEKDLTLRTGQLLYDKLKASGANVILTRSNDSYLSLSSRVGMSHYHNADAFISIHYDSIIDSTVRGMTSYYYHDYQKSLATLVHTGTISQAKLKDRGVRVGDYHVIRENKRSSVLLELGYLSNPSEEMLISSGPYQERVASGIYQGLAKYFKGN